MKTDHFRYTDAGRKHSKRPRQKDDCTVRALALAFGLDYDAAYDFLSKQGRKSHRGFNLGRLLDKHRDTVLLDCRVESHSFPAVKGEPRMNAGTFVKQYGEGTYIIRVSKHVAAVRDGVLQDTDTYWEKCVYKAWKVTRQFTRPETLIVRDFSY